MGKSRLEAFSDGVLAIIITIMVLDLRPPHEASLAALRPLLPVFLSYLLSFVYIGIYWNNHHHMLQTLKTVSGPMLWANLNLLFWLSLFPFVTSWVGSTSFAAGPTAAYGAVMLLAAIAYFILQSVIVSYQGPNGLLKKAIGDDRKGKISPLLYTAAIALSFWSAPAAIAIYVAVALMWLVPDRRIERALAAQHPL